METIDHFEKCILESFVPSLWLNKKTNYFSLSIGNHFMHINYECVFTPSPIALAI